jgi:hypothetical protein
MSLKGNPRNPQTFWDYLGNERQKPVTDKYKNNWDNIFGKKNKDEGKTDEPNYPAEVIRPTTNKGDTHD